MLSSFIFEEVDFLSYIKVPVSVVFVLSTFSSIRIVNIFFGKPVQILKSCSVEILIIDLQWLGFL